MKTLSAVVLAFNSPGLKACLKSLKEQEAAPLEVIVVNAGAPIEVEGCKVIQDPGGSQSKDRNLGAKTAMGEIVAFLDSDCMAPPFWVNRILRGGQKAVGGPYIPAQDTEFARGAHRNIAKIAGWRTATFADKGGLTRELPSLSGGNCAYDRQAFLSVGGFDERQHYREEPELGRKLREVGVPSMFDPYLWVWHEWKGWDGLLALAKAAHYYGRIRVWSDRELHGQVEKGAERRVLSPAQSRPPAPVVPVSGADLT